MRIRREQGLLIAVVLLGLWIWSGTTSAVWPSRLSWDRQDYERVEPPALPLVAEVDKPELGRDAFVEPTESKPLPPRVLPAPDFGSLPVVALPLDPGPYPLAYHVLRIPGGAIEPFQFGGEGPGAPSGGTGEPDDGDGNLGVEPTALGTADAAGEDRNYDRVFTSNQPNTPLIGFIRKPDKYGLVGKNVGAFTETVIFDWVSRKTGKVFQHGLKIVPADILKVELADTLRNRVELHRLALGSGPTSLTKRRAFVLDLLRDARNEPWVYDFALQQAEAYERIDNGASPVGYGLQALVLRERGDLAAEWKLYEGLRDKLPDKAVFKSFLLTSTGDFEARLGLDLDAEKHLREAQADGANPHVALALVRFLLARGRPREALVPADAAARNWHMLPTEEEQFRAWATILKAQLALGDLDAARAAVAKMPTGEEFAARRDQLRAAVAYGAREPESARELFVAAVAASSMGDAALGLAACLLLENKWAEAETAFRSVADEYPLLRHRALAGLGLLYERTGHLDQALGELEAAAVVAPRDPYLLYLLGRMRRLNGQAAPAVEALEAALQASDEFVEAHAELALTYLSMADGGGPEAILRARRYADRTVELDSVRQGDVTYLLLQGVVCFREGDRRAARDAFAAGADRSLLCRIGQALVEYSYNRVGEARARLEDLRRDLKTGHPMRPYVERTIALIDDHAEKEELVDSFDRTDLGRNWDDTEAIGRVRPRLSDGGLHIAGRLSQSGAVFAKRLQPTAGKFLRAEITIQLGDGDRSKYAVLELETAGRRGRAGREFRVRLGFQDQKPYLQIDDGNRERAQKPEDLAKWDRVDLPDVADTPHQPHRLAIAAVQADEGPRFILQAFWDGVLVHERQVEKLNRGASAQLHVGLVVEGGNGSNVDVTFDDFRLMRRKEDG